MTICWNAARYSVSPIPLWQQQLHTSVCANYYHCYYNDLKTILVTSIPYSWPQYRTCDPKTALVISRPHSWSQDHTCDPKTALVISRRYLWSQDRTGDLKTAFVISRPYWWSQDRTCDPKTILVISRPKSIKFSIVKVPLLVLSHRTLILIKILSQVFFFTIFISYNNHLLRRQCKSQNCWCAIRKQHTYTLPWRSRFWHWLKHTTDFIVTPEVHDTFKQKCKTEQSPSLETFRNILSEWVSEQRFNVPLDTL